MKKKKPASIADVLEAETFHYEPPKKLKRLNGKKRAAAYCRVSTLSEDQELSFDSQASYYTEMIGRNPDLVLVGIYGDHGFSGLDMSRRKEFQRMLDRQIPEAPFMLKPWNRFEFRLQADLLRMLAEGRK